MNIPSLLREFDLTIDDIRWYLSVQMAKKFLEFKDHEYDLTTLIWSKKLETELYNMEEQYLSDLQEDLDNKYIDEVDIRNILSEVVMEKRKRREQENNYT
jgi:hypothetical protein